MSIPALESSSRTLKNPQAGARTAECWLASVLSALLLWASFPPWQVSYVAWVALIPWAWAVQSSRNLWVAMTCGFVSGFVFTALEFDWLRTSYTGSPLVKFGPYAAAWILFVVCCGLVQACGSCGLALLLRRGHRFSFALPLAWTAHEQLLDVILRSFSGVPSESHQLAVSQANFLPWLQLGSLGGTIAIGWIVAVINGFALDLVPPTPRVSKIAVAQILFATIYGLTQMSVSYERGPRILVRPELRFDSSLIARESDARRSTGEDRVDLIIWPELAIDRDASSPEVIAQLHQTAQIVQAPILVGAYRLQPQPVQLRNSVVLAAPGQNSVTFSDKRFLTPSPFEWHRETPPASPATEVMRHVPGESELFPSTEPPRIFEIGEDEDAPSWRFAVGICFDMSFTEWPREVLRSPTPPDFLVHCASELLDRTGRAQSLSLISCQLRCVETGRSMIRCVHFGHSTAIDPAGRIGRLRPPEEWSQSFVSELPLGTKQTVYSKAGQWCVAIFVLVFLLVGLYRGS